MDRLPVNKVLLFIVLSLHQYYMASLPSRRDYCSIVCKDGQQGGHTMCKYPDGPATSCKEYQSYNFTQQNIKDLLNEHNAVREDISRTFVDKEQRKLPPLRWDVELATMSKRLADQCFESSLLTGIQECRGLGDPDEKDAAVLQNTFRIVSKTPWKELISMRKLVRYFLENEGSMSKATGESANSVGCGATSFRSHLDDRTYVQLIVCDYAYKPHDKSEVSSKHRTMADKSQVIDAAPEEDVEEEDYKIITVNIYNRIRDADELPDNRTNELQKGNFLMKHVLHQNRMRGYSSLSKVRPVYGKWKRGQCRCLEPGETRDKKAESEFYRRIEKARETGQNLYYQEGQVCVCGVEGSGNSRPRVGILFILKVLWIYMMYFIMR